MDEPAGTERLQQLTLALGEALTEAAVAQVVLQHAVPALGADAGAIARLSPAGTMLELIGWIGFPDEVNRYQRFSVEARLPYAMAVRRGQPLFLETFEELVEAVGPEALHWKELGNQQLGASVALPLQAGGRMLGSLGVSFNLPQKFTPPQRELAVLVSRLCAQALQRAQAFEREQRARREAEGAQAQLELLANASHQLFGTLDQNQICQVLTKLAVEAGLAEFASVDLLEKDALVRAAVHARDPVWLALELRRRELTPRIERDDPVRAAIRSKMPQLETATLHRPGEREEQGAGRLGWQRFAHRFLLRSRLVVPLMAGPEPLGALSIVTSALTGRELLPRDLVLANELASRAASALQNARLYSQAREAIGVRDDFLSIAGHELRTPLTVLKLQLQSSVRLLNEAPGPMLLSTVADRTEKAARQVDRLQALVDRLLDVSRIAAGHFSLEVELLSLDQIVREACGRFAEEAASASCKLSLRPREDSLELRGRWDRMRLEQLLENLLANAVKYGRGRPIEVEVDRAGAFGVVRVRDHGVGIAPADQARVFERFERAASAVRVRGLGLGLWIARQIVESHRGTIEVKSELGRGAEFIFTLPLQTPAP